MRICMVLEGCYPYVRGGVSSWMHSYIQGMPQHEFVLWVIGAQAKDRGKFKYELPENVAEIHEVFLDEALTLRPDPKKTYHFTEDQSASLKQLIACETPDWELLFDLYNNKKVHPISYLMCEDFLDTVIETCKTEFPYVAFSDWFHTVRSMLVPTLYLMSQEVPKADVFHATSTGYGGLLGALGGWKNHVPFILTEHGIYTREREEEILRAKWVLPYFKQQWINFFYMLSKCSYDRANVVTALFERYSEIQHELGARRSKLKWIGNGIPAERYQTIPDKKKNGWIDIGAVVRFHPIKDIKTMIYAFFDLKQRVKNVRLHILGDIDDEEYYQECMELINQLGVPDILVVGNKDVISYMNDLDFTVLSSISEGQPLAVLESMAASRPCVATDVGCCRELLTGIGYDDFGEAGFIVPPMNSQGIANAMFQLATNDALRKKMGETGRKRVVQSFQHRDMITNYLKNYEEVMLSWQASDLN